MELIEKISYQRRENKMGVTGIERSREGGSWPRIDGVLRRKGRKVSWLPRMVIGRCT